MALFTNFATLSYSGGERSSNTVTGEILETVSISKTAVTNEYAAGDTVSFAVTLVNSGTAPVTGLTLSDDLGAYALNAMTLYPLRYVPDTLRFFVNGALQPAPTVTAGPPLAVTGIDIPAGGSAVLVYETEVTAYAPLAPDSEITNTATGRHLRASDGLGHSPEPGPRRACHQQGCDPGGRARQRPSHLQL